MQQAKAARIKMSFQPSPHPCIAVSDSGIVERIVATLISNAVKFTTAGAVQPFIWPLEELQGKLYDRFDAGPIASDTSFGRAQHSSEETLSTASISSGSNVSGSKRTRNALQLQNKKMKFMAVGVADTGHGLSPTILESAKYAISTSTSNAKSHGAQNTGFGLYHAHLQTRALKSHLRLSNMEDCNSLLNEDMLNAKSQCQSSSDMIVTSNNPGEGSAQLKDGDIPGRGTVLYFTIPVVRFMFAAIDRWYSSTILVGAGSLPFLITSHTGLLIFSI